MSAAANWVAERGLDMNWDKEAAQNYAEMQDDTTYYQIWLEDALSVEEKMKLIEDADLKELTRRTVRKLNKVTDEEFAGIDFTVYDGDEESEDNDHE